MKILELKNTIFKINSLDKLNGKKEMTEKRVNNLKIAQLKLSNIRNTKKEGWKTKMKEPQGPVEQFK